MRPRGRVSGAAILAGALGLGACALRGPRQEVPAVLTSPTPAGRAELASTVSRALHGRPVTLAEDALTRESTLLVERTARRDAEGRRLDGRERERPEEFRLVTDGARCVLVRQATGERFELKAVTCAPRPDEPPPARSGGGA